MVFRDRGPGSKAWYLHMVKLHGFRGTDKVREMIVGKLQNRISYKEYIDDLVQNRYVHMLGKPNHYIYELTTLGQRYLSENQHELGDVPAVDISKIEDKPAAAPKTYSVPEAPVFVGPPEQVTKKAYNFERFEPPEVEKPRRGRPPLAKNKPVERETEDDYKLGTRNFPTVTIEETKGKHGDIKTTIPPVDPVGPSVEYDGHKLDAPQITVTEIPELIPIEVNEETDTMDEMLQAMGEILYERYAHLVSAKELIEYMTSKVES